MLARGLPAIAVALAALAPSLARAQTALPPPPYPVYVIPAPPVPLVQLPTPQNAGLKVTGGALLGTGAGDLVFKPDHLPPRRSPVLRGVGLTLGTWLLVNGGAGAVCAWACTDLNPGERNNFLLAGGLTTALGIGLAAGGVAMVVHGSAWETGPVPVPSVSIGPGSASMRFDF
jgi:hypothetical protein